MRRSQSLITTPQRVSLAVSLAVFALIQFLGFWDVEDLFNTGYSIGSQFGQPRSKADATGLLTQSLFGVPVADFGIIGGYRLPLADGTISTGPMWFLRSFIPAELMLALPLLGAMILSGLAFGHFWGKTRGFDREVPRISLLMCGLCYLTLCYPTILYMLEQDYFTIAFVSHGTIAVISSLLTLALDHSSTHSTTLDFRKSLRYILLGSYFLLLGHTGTVVQYIPTMAVVALTTIWIRRQQDRSRRRGFKFGEWRFELLLLGGLVVRGASLLVELTAEVSRRSSIGGDQWWVSPTQSVSNLKHFVAQFVSTEFRPWLAIFRPSFLETYDIELVSRIPHMSATVVLLLLIGLVVNRRRRNAGLIGLLLGLWVTNFLLMTRVVRNPIRESGDYLYQDVLLTLAMLAVGLTIASDQHVTSPRKSHLRVLTVALALTSVTVAISYPVFHLQEFRKASPYSLINSLRDRDPWIDTFHAAAGREQGVLAVVDERFLSRWSDERVPNRIRREWEGLRGFYEVREAGFTTLEGSPKIRDASPFSGLTNSLKQNIDPPSADFCSPELLSFLRVTTLLMSPSALGMCYSRVAKGAATGTLSASEAVPLVGSGMLISNLTGHRVFETVSLSGEESGDVKCGLLGDPTCFTVLQLTPASGWSISSELCELPCVMRLARTDASQRDKKYLVVPFNSGIALRAVDQFGNELPQHVFNGLLAVHTTESVTQISIVTGTDWRMWLQVVSGYLQYAALLPLLVNVTRGRSIRGATKRQRLLEGER